MKNISCSLGRSNFGTFLVILLSFLVLSLLVQFCRLNQNVLVQAATQNQRGQSETNRLNLPDREGADKSSSKRLIPQAENMSSTSTGDPKFEKSEVIQKTKKLQMPFIANNGQMDEKVMFYANTFGGTVFITKDGDIVYSLPNNSSDVETQYLASLMHPPNGIRDEVGMLHDCNISDIVHPASWLLGLDSVCRLGEAKRTQQSICEQHPFEFPFANGDLRNGGFSRNRVSQPPRSQTEFRNESNPQFPTQNPHSEICNPHSEIRNQKSEINGVALNEDVSPRPLRERDRVRGVSLKEELVGAKISEIQGEEKSVTNVNYFKGKDPSKWKTNISAYDIVNLGEVYKGIELKLKAYGNNVEKLFCVKPGADHEQIKIRLSGIKDCGMQNAECGNNTPLSPLSRGDKSEFGNQKLPVNTHGEPDVGWVKRSAPNKQLLSINEHGELEIETELGPVKFTKPVAYQEIDGKRVNVECRYTIADCGMQDAECKTHLKPEAGSQRQEAVGCVKPVLSFVEGRSAPNKNGLNGLNGLNQLNGLESKGKRQMSSREKGMGRKGKYLASNLQLPIQNSSSTSIRDSQSAIRNPKLVLDFDRGSEIDNPSPATRHSSTTYSFTVASYDKTKDLIIDPLLASTFLGGSGSDYCYYLALDTSGNVYVTGVTYSTDFPTTSGVYDTSFNGGDNDVFISKLDDGLTKLLASTYLGGSDSDSGSSLTLDTTGNVYVTGETYSTDFPTTNGAYDTSFNGGNKDVFILKLDDGLTSLLASTYLGGSDYDYCSNSIAFDTSGNVYATGYTYSSNFPTTSGSYNTTKNGYYDVFVSKLNGGLTSLLASTYLGGSDYEESNSLAIDTSGNVYVMGHTRSSDFPVTSGAYNTYSNNSSTYYSDVFVSKLDGGLTSLLASTYLGGSKGDDGYSFALDTSGDVYVTGRTYSSNFPTTSGAYDTSMNGNHDVFVSKLDGRLTSLLASTYLGGSSDDSGYSLALDTSGNAYVTGLTYSTNFPTTSGAYNTSFNGGDVDAFVSKLDSGLTNLLVSTYIGGSSNDWGSFLTLDTSGNVYVVGQTDSTDFPITSGVYDTSFNGGDHDVFVSKLDINLSYLKPTVTTGSATNVTMSSVTLNGIVNANNWSTTAWFDSGTTSGSYDNKSSTETVTGSSDTTVSISISGLSLATTYYYRIAAESDTGTSYGDEMSFTTLSDTTTSTGTVIINSGSKYATSAEATLTLSATDDLGVTGYYISEDATTPSASNSEWTSITSTTSYSADISYTLSNGDGTKTVYVWYKDDSENVSSPASDSIILDTTPPTVTITSPTSNDTYTTTDSKISIGGGATDSTSGINTITWSNNYGLSGTVNGTTGWSILEISLLIGENIITVTATDNAGNTGTDTITITYSITPTPTPQPTAEPEEKGSISGNVVDTMGNPIENAKIRLKRENIIKKTVSDENGLFEFLDLEAGKYVIKAVKKGYKKYKQAINLEEGEEMEIEIEMKKISKRIIKTSVR